MIPPGASWAGPRALALAALTMVCACIQQPPPSLPGPSADEARSPARHAPAVDPGLMRAPEVFRASGVALWDGNRTVSGLWVAHPAATRTRQVRVVNPATGAEIDAMLYRPGESRMAAGGDVVTVSSEAAQALGIAPGTPTSLALFGLRPQGAISIAQRRATEATAQTELASHLGRMDGIALVPLVAAAMRGMGYATVLEPAAEGNLPEIRAFPRPDGGLQPPATRVLVRPGGVAPMSAAELSRRQALLTNSGDLGMVVSVAGFAEDARNGLDPTGARVEMVDVEGLLEIWLTHYQDLSGPDRALLPLQPVWFLAEADPAVAASGW